MEESDNMRKYKQMWKRTKIFFLLKKNVDSEL